MRLSRRLEGFGLRFVEGKESGPQPKEKKRRWDDDDGVHPDGASGETFGGGGQEALDEGLRSSERPRPL